MTHIKPTAIKEIEGNPGKRAINHREPKPDPSMPTCPGWLDYWGRKEWARVCPELHRLGLLTGIDQTSLAGYCAAYSRWVKAEKELYKDGGFTYAYIDKDFKTKRHNKPEVIIARDALAQVRQFCIEFGMTPSSRAKMTLPGDRDKDPFDKLMDFCKEKPDA